MLRLTGVIAGLGPDADITMLDEQIARMLIDREIKHPGSTIAGRTTDEILTALEPRTGPERLLDFLIRTGPYGDGFGADSDGLTLAKLEAQPHGIDLGALKPRLPDALRTASGKIELAPEPIVADVERLQASLARTHNGGLVLVGRRQLRSNNSWMHNLPLLVRGKPRCTLQVHPADAVRHGLVEGGDVVVSSRAGTVTAPVEVTDTVMPGVVSLPHGWGHSFAAARTRVARAHAGVNSNILTDEQELDVPSGNAVLNGIPVTLTAVDQYWRADQMTANTA
jgi:anaerobic selenocysteine-containing dehydrogenase